jgi:hypothetical protein
MLRVIDTNESNPRAVLFGSVMSHHMDQTRKYPRFRAKSALPQIALQNSQNAVRLIFREKMKQAAIVDRCSLKPATEVLCKFVTG